MSNNEVYQMPNGNLCYADGREYVSPDAAVKTAFDYSSNVFSLAQLDTMIDSIMERHTAKLARGRELLQQYKAGTVTLADLSAEENHWVYLASGFTLIKAGVWWFKKQWPELAHKEQVQRTAERRRLNRKHRH
ncbi:MAG TPA: hypothetical protein VF598_07725 [Hymenobacter sp.]